MRRNWHLKRCTAGTGRAPTPSITNPIPPIIYIMTLRRSAIGNRPCSVASKGRDRPIIPTVAIPCRLELHTNDDTAYPFTRSCLTCGLMLRASPTARPANATLIGIRRWIATSLLSSIPACEHLQIILTRRPSRGTLSIRSHKTTNEVQNLTNHDFAARRISE